MDVIEKEKEKAKRTAHHAAGGLFEICRLHSGCPRTHYIGTLEELFEQPYKAAYDGGPMKTRTQYCGISMGMQEFLDGTPQQTAYWVCKSW